MLNLILAVFWLCLAVGIFVYQSLLPADDRRALLLMVQVPGFPPFSAGWLALLLTGWNVFRWWLRRAHREHLQSVHDAEAEWKRRRRQIVRQDPARKSTTPNSTSATSPAPPPEGPREANARRPPPERDEVPCCIWPPIPRH
jgi:hypothetical protein